MLEVEVKIKIDSLEEVKKILEEKGAIFSDVKVQEDDIFVQDASSVESFYKNKVFIRIRKVDGNTPVFTLKKKQADLASLEYEVGVTSSEECIPILRALDYTHAVSIKKSRYEAQLGGYTFCLDQVEGLGSFLEVEKLVEEGDITALQNEMFSYLLSLGLPLDENKRVTDAYDTLLLREKLKV